jgi:histidyl-tRNA synthetase
MLRRADSLAATICVVVGDSELDKGIVQVKDLAEHTQTEVPRTALLSTIRDRILRAARADEGGV